MATLAAAPRPSASARPAAPPSAWPAAPSSAVSPAIMRKTFVLLQSDVNDCMCASGPALRASSEGRALRVPDARPPEGLAPRPLSRTAPGTVRARPRSADDPRARAPRRAVQLLPFTSTRAGAPPRTGHVWTLAGSRCRHKCNVLAIHIQIFYGCSHPLIRACEMAWLNYHHLLYF